jgi:hypothetical protein
MGFYVEDNDDNVFMLKMRLQLLGDFEVEHSIGHISADGCHLLAAAAHSFFALTAF